MIVDQPSCADQILINTFVKNVPTFLFMIAMSLNNKDTDKMVCPV